MEEKKPGRIRSYIRGWERMQVPVVVKDVVESRACRRERCR